MLDQLPAAQRQQALDALRQYQGNQQTATREEAPTPALSPIPVPEPDADELSAGPNSQLVITSTPDPSLTEEQLRELDADPLLSRLKGNQTFVLDETGALSLYGVLSIPLLGLSEADIERRLSAEQLLAPFDVTVRILETTPTGIASLKPFGYELFTSREASFDPPMAGPVPPDYVLGPGDTVRVQLFGNVNDVFENVVSRDGVLSLPDLGPITVAGLRFSEFRADLDRRVREMMIGTQVSVSMGQLRTIRVFVLGDANRPGSYVVSSLATISSALYRSGGISDIGSLRDVQLKRNGRVVSRLDLYDLLLEGNTSNDTRLQPGDVIFIPPVGAQVSVSGAVKRPAIYELRGKATVADVVKLAGGLVPDAFLDGARIERVDAGKARVVLNVDADNKLPVLAGDVLTIPEVLPDLIDTVTLLGHVHRPGPYQWRQGMRLSDVIASRDELRPGGDTEYILIRRESERDGRVHVLSARLADDIELDPRDTIHVFGLAYGRQRVIQPILEELELQSRLGDPYEEVSVSGQVKAPGPYPLEPRMRVSDLLRAGGDLSEQAFTLQAELVRYQAVAGTNRQTEIVDVDLSAILRGDAGADLVLREHDNLRVSRVPDWDSLITVELEGEVVFPGTYRARRGETLSRLLERAGGLTDEAFPEGAIFLRESLRNREQEQIEVLAQRLEADLMSMSLEERAQGADSVATGRSLLAQLRQSRAVGRLVIDLRGIASGDERVDVEMRNSDRLLVPKMAQEVTIIGETQQNTSHLYQTGLSRDDYISLSGGLTRRADRKLIYVVRASGAVVTGGRSRWTGRGDRTEIRPGDTIVVPLDTDRVRPLTLWANVTQILYQGAIAVAAVQSFN